MAGIVRAAEVPLQAVVLAGAGEAQAERVGPGDIADPIVADGKRDLLAVRGQRSGNREVPPGPEQVLVLPLQEAGNREAVNRSAKGSAKLDGHLVALGDVEDGNDGVGLVPFLQLQLHIGDNQSVVDVLGALLQLLLAEDVAFVDSQLPQEDVGLGFRQAQKTDIADGGKPLFVDVDHVVDRRALLVPLGLHLHVVVHVAIVVILVADFAEQGLQFLLTEDLAFRNRDQVGKLLIAVDGVSGKTHAAELPLLAFVDMVDQSQPDELVVGILAGNHLGGHIGDTSVHISIIPVEGLDIGTILGNPALLVIPADQVVRDPAGKLAAQRLVRKGQGAVELHLGDLLLAALVDGVGNGRGVCRVVLHLAFLYRHLVVAIAVIQVDDRLLVVQDILRRGEVSHMLGDDAPDTGQLHRLVSDHLDIGDCGKLVELEAEDQLALFVLLGVP